jgi:hypothetical protein
MLLGVPSLQEVAQAVGPVADDEDDALDADADEGLEGPLDEGLAVHAHHALGAVLGVLAEPLSHPCGKYHRLHEDRLLSRCRSKFQRR